jgi:hypothetical protein
VESWSPGGVHLESVGEGKLHSVAILLLICLQHSRYVWETQNKPDPVGKRYLEQVSTAISGSQSTKWNFLAS